MTEMTRSQLTTASAADTNNYPVYKMVTFHWWLFAGCALLAYCLPALHYQSAALTLNSFDLAEWTTLHPVARQNQLMVAFFLRVQPLIIGTLLALNMLPIRKKFGHWFSLCLLVLIALTEFPPLEFLNNQTDPNYQQQLFIAGLSLLTGMIIFTRLPYRLRNLLNPLLLIVGIVSYGWALSQSIDYMKQYAITPQVGAGTIIIVAIYIAMVLITGAKSIQTSRAAI